MHKNVIDVLTDVNREAMKASRQAVPTAGFVSAVLTYVTHENLQNSWFGLVNSIVIGAMSSIAFGAGAMVSMMLIYTRNFRRFSNQTEIPDDSKKKIETITPVACLLLGCATAALTYHYVTPSLIHNFEKAKKNNSEAPQKTSVLLPRHSRQPLVFGQSVIHFSAQPEGALRAQKMQSQAKLELTG